MTTRLAIMGGGNMGAALLNGLLEQQWAPAHELVVVEVLPARREQLAARYPGLVVSASPVAAEAAVLAVKPTDAGAAMRALVEQGCVRVLSIAAGVTIRTLEAAAGRPVAVVRAMPNTPALVGAGVAAIAAGTHAGDADLAWAESILRAVGTVERVPEDQLDAVTGLTGSGPAYVFLFAEALIEAGVLVGLSRAASRAMVTQLLVGSAKLLTDSGELPEVLRANVTSPAGTTAAGLRALERAGMRAAVLDAVVAATERARELGRE